MSRRTEDPSASAPRLHDADWLAELLGVSRQRVYALAREGVVPCVKIGRRIRFEERAVYRWIEQGGSDEHRDRQRPRS